MPTAIFRLVHLFLTEILLYIALIILFIYSSDPTGSSVIFGALIGGLLSFLAKLYLVKVLMKLIGAQFL